MSVHAVPARLDDRLRNLVACGRALPRPRTPAALDTIAVHVSDDEKLAELAMLAAQWAGGKVLGKLLDAIQQMKLVGKLGCFAAGTRDAILSNNHVPSE